MLFQEDAAAGVGTTTAQPQLPVGNTPIHERPVGVIVIRTRRDRVTGNKRFLCSDQLVPRVVRRHRDVVLLRLSNHPSTRRFSGLHVPGQQVSATLNRRQFGRASRLRKRFGSDVFVLLETSE